MVHTTQAEAFVQGPSAGLALSRPATFAAKQRAPGVKVLRRAAVPALRMQEEGLKEDKPKVPEAADPYEVKKEVPSWAKEENQWELDQVCACVPCVCM